MALVHAVNTDEGVPISSVRALLNFMFLISSMGIAEIFVDPSSILLADCLRRVLILPSDL